ncbi:MAG TPA: MBL fold metallo-hydrolase [Ktedonobacterales bacterium]|nr:MBL fold metallo-hydrolase [Ktedonobacterales bacterium]
MAWRFRPFGQGSAALHLSQSAVRPSTRPSTTQPLPISGVTPVEDDDLVARFWGVRGSYPTPRVGGGRVGGETTCLEIRHGRHTLIIDAGSGAISLGEELMRRAQGSPTQRHDVTLLLTHAHHDHLCGLPFFAPLYDPHFHVRFFGPDLADMRFGEIIAGYMRAPYFPVDFHALPSQRTLSSLRDGDRLLLPPESAPRIISAGGAAAPIVPANTLAVDALFSNLHPANGTMVYRVTAGAARLVFATDVEARGHDVDADRRLIDFARGADTLIHDAQYSQADYDGDASNESKRGYGHSTPAMAVRVARDAGVSRLVLFHHDPHYSDETVMQLQQRAREGFPEVVAAREGLELRLDGARRRLV